MQASLKALSALAVVAATITLPAQAVQRTFVASFGNDANTAANCGFANPCRGFTAAHSVTDPNGEIVALDAAGYGAVTITKSITITANPGFYAGIAASSGNAVTIATAGVNVILRGLNINSLGALNGVSMTAGNSLSIENCVISNFRVSSSGAGVYVSAAARVKVVDSLIRDNYNGIYLEGGVTGTIANVKALGNVYMAVWVHAAPAATTNTVAITDSVFSGQYVGVYANGVATANNNVTVTRSTSSNNQYGIATDGTANSIVTAGYSQATGNSSYGFYVNGASNAFRSQGNNTVDQNTNNTGGTITPLAGT
jgi:hypothetical protein